MLDVDEHFGKQINVSQTAEPATPVQPMVSWISRETTERQRLRARAIASKNTDWAQFEDGYLRALGDITKQLLGLS